MNEIRDVAIGHALVQEVFSLFFSKRTFTQTPWSGSDLADADWWIF